MSERYDIKYEPDSGCFAILDRKGMKERVYEVAPVIVRIPKDRLIKLVLGVYFATRKLWW